MYPFMRNYYDRAILPILVSEQKSINLYFSMGVIIREAEKRQILKEQVTAMTLRTPPLDLLFKVFISYFYEKEWGEL